MSIKRLALSQLLEAVVDNRGRTCPTAKGGRPLIATNCISNDRLYPQVDNLRFVDQETYENWFRGHPRPGDILFVLKGDPGRCCLVPDPITFCVAQDMVALRPESAVVEPAYLFATLRSPLVREVIANMHVGTMIPHFKKGDFDKLILPIPDRRTQKEIGSVYMHFEQKIDLNRRISETLETMARAIFKDWFVDFGPTRAKMEGRPPYLAPEIWALFPDQFDGEGKPLGWQQSTLGTHTINLDSKRVPLSGAERAKRRGPYPYHGATGIMDHIDQYLFDGIHLLVGEDGSVVKESGLAFTQYVWGQFWVNNHAHVLQGRGYVSTEQLLMHFQHEMVTPYVTGAVQLKLSQGRMNLMPFIDPGEGVCRAFTEITFPLFARLRSCGDECATLAATRDFLLPKLISGEVQVTEAAKVIETAA